MDITLSNHLCTVTSVSEDEEEWLEDYLSISEPIFAKDYRSGRMVRKGTATHCFVKRGNFPAGFLRLVYKGAKREGYRLNITDQRVGASVEPCIPDYHVVYNFAEELALKKSGVARAWLRYYQMDALKAVIHRRRGIIWHPTGAGKCLAPDTEVMRYDGTLVKARDVVAGDQLMGPDSKRRNVLSTTTGTSDMYRIVPTKGKPWECNDVHVLTLVHTTSGKIIDIPLNEYLKKSKTFKHCYKLFQPERVDFAKACTNLPVDPYFVGVWLGDGTKDLRSVAISKPDIEIEQLCNYIADEFELQVKKDTYKPCPTYRMVTERGKPNRLLRELHKLFQHSLAIPHVYQTARRIDRLALLAGILDTDGHLAKGYFEIVQKDDKLAKSIAFLARSLGFRVQEKLKCVNGYEYHRLTILGDIHLIPTRIPRKQAPDRNQKKNALRTGFTVEKVGTGEYAGFTLDGDGRFLLGDFTVTHNTELAVALAQSINVKWLFIVQDKDLLYNAAERYEKRTGKKAGIIGDGKVELDVDGNFIVAMAQTLDRKRGDHELWEVVRTAEGLIIDECHQTPAKTIFQITQMSENAVYRVGLSGTPLDRGDQKGMATIGALGPIIHKVKSQELQNAGFLAEAIIEMLTYDHRASSAKTYQGAYGKDIVKNAKRNKLVIETMQRADKPNLTFVKQLNHGKELLKKAEKAGLRVEFVWGEASSSKRGELIKRLERGDLDCIICNVVWQQGIDIPSLASIIRASAGKSVISALQTIGRGTRVTEWKNRFQVFDIFDRLSQEGDEGEKDWFLKHSRARKRSYEREGHKVNVVDTRQLRLL